MRGCVLRAGISVPWCAEWALNVKQSLNQDGSRALLHGSDLGYAGRGEDRVCWFRHRMVWARSRCSAEDSAAAERVWRRWCVCVYGERVCVLCRAIEHTVGLSSAGLPSRTAKSRGPFVLVQRAPCPSAVMSTL